MSEPILKWVQGRIKANKNCLVVVNGSTGSGKSYLCLSLAQQIAESLGTNFTIEDNLSFKFPELLKKMKRPQNDKPGTVFIFEETGAFGSGSSSREWASKSNKYFFSFMQTSRHKNQILLMNTPNFSFLEKGSRSLVHMQLQVTGIDFSKKVCYAKPYRIQINSRSGRFYFKYLRLIQNGRRVKLDKIAVSHPGEIAKEYEIKKTEYTDALNQEIIDEEEAAEKKKPITTNELNRLVKQGYNNVQMAEHFNCSTKTIQRHRKLLKEE